MIKVCDQLSVACAQLVLQVRMITRYSPTYSVVFSRKSTLASSTKPHWPCSHITFKYKFVLLLERHPIRISYPSNVLIERFWSMSINMISVLECCITVRLVHHNIPRSISTEWYKSNNCPCKIIISIMAVLEKSAPFRRQLI